MITQLKAESVLRKSFMLPDDIRPEGHGEMEQIDLGDYVFSRIILLPGWRWSRDVKHSPDIDSCQARHVLYVIAGTLMVEMDDESRTELHAGDVAIIPPGHDAWVVGDDLVRLIDFADRTKGEARIGQDLAAPADVDC